MGAGRTREIKEGFDPQGSPITRLSGVQEKTRGLIVERLFGSGLEWALLFG